MRLFWLLAAVVTLFFFNDTATTEIYTIGILQGTGDTIPASRLREMLSQSGREVLLLDTGQWSKDVEQGGAQVDLVVCPWAANLAPHCIPALQRHFERGGDMLTLGGPAFGGRLWRKNEKWLSSTDWVKALDKTGKERVLFSFDAGKLEQWHNSKSTSDSAANLNYAEGYDSSALHVQVPELKKWNTLVSPRLEKAFPAGHKITSLYAKGSGQTSKLSFEWREADGSRWVAVFPVTNQWRRIVLTPADFSCWSAGKQGKRGGPEDRFEPENAVQLTVGVSRSPTGSPAGAHEYYVDQISTAQDPFPHAERASPPPIEGLTSTFFYDVQNAQELRNPAKKNPRVAENLPVAENLQSHLAREDVVGPIWPPRERWVPILEAYDADGKWVGSPASMHIEFDGPWRGSVRTVFSVLDPEWYENNVVQRIMSSVVDRMAKGLFVGRIDLTGAGGQGRLKVRLANLSKHPKNVRMQFRLNPLDRSAATQTGLSDTVRLSPGEHKTASHQIAMSAQTALVNPMVELFHEDVLVDRACRTIRTDDGQVKTSHFLGFGAEWDPYYSSNEREWTHYSEISEKDWDTIVERIDYMDLPLVRMMMLVRWCYRPDGSYDWHSPPMRHLYRQLDECERQDIDVMLCDWGCESWTRAPGIENLADPTYARAIGTYLHHLIEEKEYDCIKYFVLVNEPNNEAKGGWERWKTGVRLVSAELDKRGLGEKVTFLGTDAAQGPMEWHTRGVDQLADLLEGYDFHLYAREENVRHGNLEAYFHKRWDYSRFNDSAGSTKPCILGEAGLMNGSASHNNNIDTYSYGLAITDYAVQAVRAESSAVSAWMLDDNSHLGFEWGMWSSSKEGLELRPWFYPWSLLTRFFPPGSRFYNPRQPSGSVRILGARVPGDGEHWSFCVVNRGEDTICPTIDVPTKKTLELDRYLYSETLRPDNEKGFPVPVKRREYYLAGGLKVKCPGNAVVILTSLPR